MSDFKYLFTPFKIGNVTVSNRIFSSGHGAHYFPPTGVPSETAINYFRARAKGGVGLIVTASHYPFWPTTINKPTAFDSDEVIPALKKLTDAIHEFGTKCFLQIGPPGTLNDSRSAGGGSIWGPSPVLRTSPFLPGRREVPHAMDLDEIRRAVESHGNMARRAKEGGYDGIEIMAAFSLLHASFISPLTNQRTDEYGGSLENRLRFLFESIEAIRANVGDDFALGVRFSGDEFTDGGITLEESTEIATRLEADGKVDYLFPCADAFGPGHIPPMSFPLAPFVYIPAAIKEAVALPVFCVGRINDPVLAERILADHQADMIGMTRATLCDPDMPNKAKEGRLDDIRRCMGCNEGCHRKISQVLPATCTYNPEAGREKELAITPAANRKRIVVVGGGAAGLETARVAALRGHQVRLYEKEDVLARELDIASKSPGREDFAEAKRYYMRQMEVLGVDVRLGVKVTPEMVLTENPDAVVIATGAVPYIPSIPGSDSLYVFEMKQVLEDERPMGRNVVIADGQSHIYGLDIAEFLAERGKSVELLTEDVFAASRVDGSTLWAVYTRVLSKGVVITPLTRIKEIKNNAVVAVNVLTGVERNLVGVDAVVFVNDGKADDSLYHALKGSVKDLYMVGQCVSPRKMIDSVYDATIVGRKL